MCDRINIFFIKSFNRLRNKAQIFSSLADDHYHTRLMHSLEVEAISIQIAQELQKIRSSKKIKSIDYAKLSTIALLHDIGHTPFGHVGEKTLHKICSGVLKIPFLPDFNRYDVACGFKHNINSALIYKEHLLQHYSKIDDFDVDILDGLMKHSDLYYKGKKKFDYGFEYVSAGLPREIKYSQNPATIEGLIVACADEISQICSDYYDLNRSGADISKLEKTKPFCKSNSADLNEFIIQCKNYLVGVLVNNLNGRSTYKTITKGVFGEILKDFGNERAGIIKSNMMIVAHDSTKAKYIEELFKYYFVNGLNRFEILEDFYYRIKRMKYNIDVVKEISALNIKKPDGIKKYFNEVVYPNISKECAEDFSKKKRASYRLIYRTYIRTIAIHISKMSDSYANHKVEKIMSVKHVS